MILDNLFNLSKIISNTPKHKLFFFKYGSVWEVRFIRLILIFQFRHLDKIFQELQQIRIPTKDYSFRLGERGGEREKIQVNEHSFTINCAFSNRLKEWSSFNLTVRTFWVWTVDILKLWEQLSFCYVFPLRPTTLNLKAKRYLKIGSTSLFYKPINK